MRAALLFPTLGRMFTCIRTSKEPLVVLVMISTVLLSILAQGNSANPGIKALCSRDHLPGAGRPRIWLIGVCTQC